MKHLTSLLLALTLALSLAACSSAPDPVEGSPSGAPKDSAPATNPDDTQPDDSQKTPPAEIDEPTEDDTADEGGKILIAYFSWSGNTETMAGMIAQHTGGDLFAIEPETPYTDDYNALLDIAQEEQRDSARPALAAETENWEDYDVVFIGFPNWWYTLPMPVLTFVEEYNFSGKTVVPFVTHGTGGLTATIRDLTAALPGDVSILDEIGVYRSQVTSSQSSVQNWAAGLKLDS